MFEYKDAITVLRFLTQFKTACNSDEVFEDTTLWIMNSFMKDGPLYSPTVQMALYGDKRTFSRLLMAGEEQISTYARAENILLAFYATNTNSAKVISERAVLKKAPMKISVKLPVSLDRM